MAGETKNVQYPRQVGREKWQGRSGNVYDTWRAALSDLAPPPPPTGSSVAPKRNSKFRTPLIIGLIAVGFCLLLVKADIWRSSTNVRACTWNIVAVEAPPEMRVGGKMNGQECYVTSGGIRASFRVFQTREGIINNNALQEHYMRVTGAASLPSANLSWTAAFSLVDLLWNNRLPMVVYEAPDHRRGYFLAPITDKIVLAGAYVSDRPESAASIQRALRLRLNPTGEALRLSVWTKLINLFALIFLVIPLVVVLLSRAIFHSFDKWWDIRSRLGLVLYSTVVPGGLLVLVWLMIRISGWSTITFASILLAVIGIGQTIFNLGRDRRTRVPLKPFNSPELTVFHILKVTDSSVDIAGAEIPAGRSLGLEIWMPRRVSCPACALSYAVYVPSQADCSFSGDVKTIEDIPIQTRQDLMVKAVQAAPPLSNGCIRCQKPVEGSSRTLPTREEVFPVNIRWGLIALGCLALAALIFWRGGMVVGIVESVPVIGGLLGELLGSFAGLIITLLAIPALYYLYRGIAGLSDLHISRGSSLRRMSACPREGIVFEDIHAVRDMTCPSCKEDREPIRSFRIVSPA